MRKLLLVILIFAAVPVFAQYGGDKSYVSGVSFPATTLDASCTGTGAGASCTLSAVTAGDDIVCGVTESSYGTIDITVSDAANGGYAPIPAGFYNGDAGHFNSIFVHTNSASGSIVPTIGGYTSSAGDTISCKAWKGASTTAAIDTAFAAINPANANYPTPNTAGVTGTNPTVGSTLTPSNSGEVLYGNMCNTGGSTPTAGSGFTLGTSLNSGFMTCWDEYKIETTATASNVPYTNATSDTYALPAVGICNAGHTASCKNPFNGLLIDLASQTSGTVVSTTNLLPSIWSSYPMNLGGSSLGTMAYANTNCPAGLATSIFTQGSVRNGQTGLCITHLGSQSDNLDITLAAEEPTSAMAECDFTFNLLGTTYAFTTAGSQGDFESCAGTTTGVTITPQILDEGGGVAGIDDEVSWSGSSFRSQGASLPSLTHSYRVAVLNNGANNTWAVTAVGNPSGGNAIYTGTFSTCPATGQIVSIGYGNWNSLPSSGSPTYTNGFSTAANNGIYTVEGCTSTQLTLNNASATAQSGTVTAYSTGATKVYDCGTGTSCSPGTLLFTDIYVTSGQGALTGALEQRIGNQGSFGPTNITIQYSNIELVPFPTGTPISNTTGNWQNWVPSPL